MLILAAVLALVTAQAEAVAAVRYVATTGDDQAGANTCLSPGTPCATPSQGVVVAAPGDTVELAAGTYDVSTNSPVIDKDIVFRGAASGPRPVLTSIYGGTLTVTSNADGLEVRHLKIQSTGGPGGAVLQQQAETGLFDDIEVEVNPSGSTYVYGFSNNAAGTGTVTLSNSVVDVSTQAFEPAVQQNTPGQLDLRNVTIGRRGDGNTAAPALGASNGRLDVDGVTITTDQARCLWLSSFSSTGHSIRNVTITQDGLGSLDTIQPCVQIDRTATLENVTVTAVENNGVAAVRVGEGSVIPQAAGVIFRNLVVNARDTALYVGAVSGFQLRRGRLRGGSGPLGPEALQTQDTQGVLSDVLVRGVGTDTAGLAAYASSTLELRNLTATSLGSRAAILARDTAALSVKNTIARAYGSATDVATADTGTLQLTNSNYADLTQGGGSITDFGGRQTADPLFVNNGVANFLLGDFHVQPGSPVIDAGIADGLNGTVDFDGQARVNGSAVDIGADEFQHPPAPPQDDPDPVDPGPTTSPVTDTPATTTPPATTPPATQVVPGPVVTISASAVRITKTGVANIRIGCPATAAGACTGTLALQTATKVRPAQARKILKLGSRSFRIAAGRQAFVGVKLTKAALRLLKRDKRIRAKALANVRDANGASRITQRLLSLKIR